MEDWQQRVVVEREELHRKVAALAEFIYGSGIPEPPRVTEEAFYSPRFRGLPYTTKDQLLRQKEAMDIYLGVLDERLAGFFHDPHLTVSLHP